MKTLSLCGAFDLHIHAAPDCFDRIGNDIEIAQQAKAAGMRAIAIKSVYESTVSRAWHMMQSVEGLTVYGGVTMDHHVGGVNPAAVDPCLKMGGKIVWMPTYHAEGHRRAFGCIGGFSYAGQSNKVMPLTPLKIIDEEEELLSETKEIVQLCGENNAILGTGHITPEEIYLLAKYCKAVHFDKLVVTHPLFLTPNLSVEQIGELHELGVYFEFCSTEVCPIPGGGDIKNYARIIDRFGVDRMLLASDGGHNRMSWPTEGLRVFAQQIAYSGVREEDVGRMIRENYEELLDL